MLLKEMFSPIGAPTQDQEEVNWLEDLHFYIDNNDKMLEKYFFPAIKRHKEHQGNPNVFKVYIRPIEHCLDSYCQKYDISDKAEKFPKEKIIELAKQFAQEQSKFIEKGDYQ
jgi:hypothetical protein